MVEGSVVVRVAHVQTAQQPDGRPAAPAQALTLDIALHAHPICHRPQLSDSCGHTGRRPHGPKPYTLHPADERQLQDADCVAQKA